MLQKKKRLISERLAVLTFLEQREDYFLEQWRGLFYTDGRTSLKD
jgi:hypothetical protein